MLDDALRHDLHLLPKIRDSLSYLYLEHGRIDQEEGSIAFHNLAGTMQVPVASLSLLLLGPGTDITHAAISTLARNNCLVIWCGEENVRFYSAGLGGTRSAGPMIRQAWLVSDPERRLGVVRRMYEMRFGEVIPEGLSIEQLRGKEGLRVRSAYARFSKEYGVEWSGRNYERSAWVKADPINRAISAANSCLYGVVHAALLSVGLSPALGFIHTGKGLSFVYDIADLYKVEDALPTAFGVVSGWKEGEKGLEREVRVRLRDHFRESRLLGRIVPDLWKVLGDGSEEASVGADFDDDPMKPTAWWGPEGSAEQGPWSELEGA